MNNKNTFVGNVKVKVSVRKNLTSICLMQRPLFNESWKLVMGKS